MATLESLESKLDELIELLKAANAVAPKPAYELPEITDPKAVVADGKTHNPDGSLWDYDWRSGGNEQMTYGYFSREKDPVTYDALVEKFGETFTEWFAKHDQWTIYQGGPRKYVETKDFNWITLTHFVLKSRGRHVQ